MTVCKNCGRLTLFNERLRSYVDAKRYGNEMAPVLNENKEPIVHWKTCSVKIQERIREHCVWCQLADGKNILVLGGLIGYMKCEAHSNENEEFSYHGKTVKRTNETLKLMLKDAHVAKRRLKRNSKKAVGTAELDTMLHGHTEEVC